MLRSMTIFGVAALFMSLSPRPAVAQSELYIFGAFGTTNVDVGLGGLNRIDARENSYALGAGYAFTRRVSVEGAYHDFGGGSGQTDCPPGFSCLVVPVRTEADVAAFSLSLIGSFPLNNRLDAYGKIGLTSWDIEFDGISSAFDDSGEDLHYGIGIRWSMSEHWKIFAEYERVKLDLDTVGIGVRFDF